MHAFRANCAITRTSELRRDPSGWVHAKHERNSNTRDLRLLTVFELGFATFVCARVCVCVCVYVCACVCVRVSV